MSDSEGATADIPPSHVGRTEDSEAAFWAKMKQTMAEAISEDPALLRRIGQAVQEGNRPNAGSCRHA
jgi:hypothetical protein